MTDIGEIKSRLEVENLIEDVLSKYSDAGFPFCRISPEIIYQGDVIEKIVLRIDEGERIVVSDYLFNVEGKTDATAIKKIGRFKENNYFSSKEIEQSKKLLSKTGVFEDIQESIVHRDDNYYVLLNITEKQSDYVTALGSLAEDNFIFGFTFYSLNLLGTLRQLQFRYEYQKLFSLHFTEPIFIAPSTFDLNFSLWTYDSARLTQLNAKFTAPLGYYLNFSIISGIEAVSYYGDSDIGQHIDNLLGLGLGLDYGKAKWGIVQEVNFEYLFRQFDRWVLKYDGEFYINGLFIKPHYYRVNTDSFEYFDYIRIGGAGDIRGYLEEEFIVSRAMWVNIEYRRFFLFPLFDIGRIGDEIQFSYGFGIEAKSDFVNASLTFAWPKHGYWRDGKVHLIFEKGF